VFIFLILKIFQDFSQPHKFYYLDIWSFLPVTAKGNFQHHYSSLQCHMIFAQEIFLNNINAETVELPHNYVETVIHFFQGLIESSREQHLF